MARETAAAANIKDEVDNTITELQDFAGKLQTALETPTDPAALASIQQVADDLNAKAAALKAAEAAAEPPTAPPATP